MKRMQTWRWVPVALLLAVGGTAGRAEVFAIQSFDGTGRLTFNEVSTATTYRVEWAPSPSGPWTNFTGAAGAALSLIEAQGSGSVTCSVPMCYRVVATMQNTAPHLGLYIVVDLSGGPDAETYDVSDLAEAPQDGWTDEYKTTKLVLRRIPATTPDFTMGGRSTDYPGASDEGLHQVTLTEDYYLGVFEVTQRQWELVMGNRPSYFNNETHYQTRPVEMVSYYDIRENPENSAISPNWPASRHVHADSFMGKLRTKTGLKGFDLPTESQWEHACRAGTTTALSSGQDLTNPAGNDPQMNMVGRYWNNGAETYGYSQDVGLSGGTAAAGSYPANNWGLYDMHGNVWEWCLDWYGGNPGTVTDPKGASSGTLRIPRGGCWYFYALYCRSAYRENSAPNNRLYFNGFRACCAP